MSAVLGVTAEALNVSVQERAVDGKANAGVIDLLATVLQVRKRQVKIVRGETHRTKLVEVSDPTDETRNRLDYWKTKGS